MRTPSTNPSLDQDEQILQAYADKFGRIPTDVLKVATRPPVSQWKALVAAAQQALKTGVAVADWMPIALGLSKRSGRIGRINAFPREP